MPYNEFSLNQACYHDISVGTFFTPVESSPAITLFKGDGTFRGFYQLVRSVSDRKVFDVIHLHSPHIAMILLAWRPFLGNVLQSAVYTVHNSFLSYRLRNKLLMLLPFRAFPRVVFCSHASYESFPRLYKWLAGDRARVVQNGMDIARVDRALQNKEERGPSGAFNLAVVGRLIDIKNPALALHAFNKGRNEKSTLTFIGEGPLRETVARTAGELGLDGRVRFTGLVPRETVYDLLFDADLFLSTSKGEGLPVAVLEAMACRCPLVLSDIPPHREIAGGVDFIPLISPDDVEGFANAMRRFQRLPFDERREVGEKCRRLVETRFGLPGMLEKYERIYLELVNGRH